MRVRIKRGRLPKHAAATAKLKHGEAVIMIPEDSMSSETASALSATLTYISNKVRCWDVRNPKIAAGIAVSLVMVFTVGFIVAPSTVKRIIWNVLPGAGTASAGPQQPAAGPSDLPKLVSGDQPFHSHRPNHSKNHKAGIKTSPKPKSSASSGSPSPSASSGAPVIAEPDPTSAPPAQPSPTQSAPPPDNSGPGIPPPGPVHSPVELVPNPAPVSGGQSQGILGLLGGLLGGIRLP